LNIKLEPQPDPKGKVLFPDCTIQNQKLIRTSTSPLKLWESRSLVSWFILKYD